MLTHGINPYIYRPDAPELQSFRDTAIYPKMSSAAVYSVYPPVSQAVFFLGNLTGHPIPAIKAIYSIFDLGIVIVLWQLIGLLGLPKRNILLYAWNPLAVFEFAGSGHTDAPLLFFTLLAILFFAKNKYLGAFTALGLAIISKLLPLIFLPYFFFAVKGRRKYYLALWSGVVVLLGYLPFVGGLTTVISNFRTDVSLYLSTSLYMFNGSMFTFWYWIRDALQVYDRFTKFSFMASALSAMFGVVWLGIVASSWLSRKKTSATDIAWRVMLTFFAFLVFSPNVQVWYILWIGCFVPLFVNFERGFEGGTSIRSLANIRMSWLTWTFTVCFAYIAYHRFFTQTGPYLVPRWAIWVEYGLLFGLITIEWIWADRESLRKSNETERLASINISGQKQRSPRKLWTFAGFNI